MGKRVIFISTHFLAELIQGKTQPAETDVPRDLRVEHVWQLREDAEVARFKVLVSSTLWEDSPAGEKIPEYTPVYHKLA